MAFPELEYSTAPIRIASNGEGDADAVVLALPPIEGDDSPDLGDWPGLSESLSAIGFTGGPNGCVRVYAPEVSALPLAVVGTGATPDAAALRDAAGTAIRTLTGFPHVAIAAPFAWATRVRWRRLFSAIR